MQGPRARGPEQAPVKNLPTNPVNRAREGPLKQLKKSAKLANVLYDIRGPIMDAAKQMEEDGQKIIKLNIGNLAVFGFDAPEEIQQDMIRNLPEFGGLFGQQGRLRRAQGGDARDAEAGHRGRHARRHLPGQRRQRTDRHVHQRAARRRRRAAAAGPRLPAVDRLHEPVGRHPGALPVRRSQRLDAQPGRHPRQDHAAHQGHRGHQPEQPDRRAVFRRVCSRASWPSRASTAW
jgi:hypothetical protein